ncbi:hypothetical protein J4474_01170 [Candidatus Pacearchaeota archaeon]|nr:hypothetical protein [Candidatus Pacearchaeota archaeon]
MGDSFLQSKKDTLSRPDKSFIGGVDAEIKPLCDKINSLKNYYTTSSCSGRVVIMIEKKQKDRESFLDIFHSEISLREIKSELMAIVKNRKHKKSLVKFKMDPCILHVACRTLEDADKLLKKAQFVGWKKSGLLSLGKKIILELNSTERLEFPIIKSSKILVGDEFLEIVVEEANRKINDSWLKIRKLEKLI